MLNPLCVCVCVCVCVVIFVETHLTYLLWYWIINILELLSVCLVLAFCTVYLYVSPEGRPGISDVSPLSGI